MSAHVWNSPAVREVAAVVPDAMPVTLTGAGLLPLLPSPSWPLPLLPQHFTEPSPSSAHVWKPPAARPIAPVMPTTVTGMLELVVVPSPSWPLPFEPQHEMTPPWRSAHVWFPPALSAMASA